MVLAVTLLVCKITPSLFLIAEQSHWFQQFAEEREESHLVRERSRRTARLLASAYTSIVAGGGVVSDFLGKVIQKLEYCDTVTGSLFWYHVCLGMRHCKSSKSTADCSWATRESADVFLCCCSWCFKLASLEGQAWILWANIYAAFWIHFPTSTEFCVLHRQCSINITAYNDLKKNMMRIGLIKVIIVMGYKWMFYFLACKWTVFTLKFARCSFHQTLRSFVDSDGGSYQTSLQWLCSKSFTGDPHGVTVRSEYNCCPRFLLS